MLKSDLVITDVIAEDIRFPTSLTNDASDAVVRNS